MAEHAHDGPSTQRSSGGGPSGGSPSSGSPSKGWESRDWGSVLLFGWLVVMWTALWGSPTPANLLGGAAVAAGVLSVFPRDRTAGSKVMFRPVHFAVFGVWFLGQLVVSSLRVAWLIVKPSGPDEMEPGIIAAPIRGVSDQLTSMVANAITLTPGTLTVEVSREPSVIYVHVLEAQAPDDIRTQVLDLERRMVIAFGSRSARSGMADATIPDVREVRR